MLIQIFLEILMIIGINTINVPTIAINVVCNSVLKIRFEMTKAATAKAIPTP
jgi:hypothetical protein